MEPAIDIVLLVVGLLVVLAGWRRGALVTVGAFVGMVAGFSAGTLLGPVVVTLLAPLGLGAPVARTVVAAATLFLCIGILYSLAVSGAVLIRRHVKARSARGVDAVGGAAAALLAWAVVVWLVAGFLVVSGLPGPAALASSSRVVAVLNAISPVPPTKVLGALDDVLGRAGLPEVFLGGEDVRPVGPPDPSIPQAVRDASASVVKVRSAAPRCGIEADGSGWVAAPGRVVTNAHVVAGSSRLAVQLGTVQYPATLTYFDPGHDLAVLEVPGLPAKPLPLGPQLEAGASAVVAGYPGGGGLTLEPARVRQVVNATGTDIYREKPVLREVYALRGTVRQGDSGGPLLDASGRVAGVVFARSADDPETGYALTVDEAEEALDRAGAEEVSSGRCTVG